MYNARANALLCTHLTFQCELAASKSDTDVAANDFLVIARLFVCSQARRGGSRGGARGEAATAPTAICSGVVGGRRYYEEGSHGAQVVFFFSIPARLCAFSDSGRWQLRVAAGYGHRARRQGHFGAWVCLLGSWGWFRPLSAVAGPAELAFLVKALFLNWAYR